MKCSILLFLLLPFLGFSQQTITGSITHNNQQREYILYVPASYSGNDAVPLVFNFHGYTSSAVEQLFYSDFRPIADTAGFIVVHPQGTVYNGSTHWNVGGWIVGSPADDVGFTDALLSHLSNGYNIDLTRVYATGMSNGGFMSFLLACQLSDKFTAVASVTGSMTPSTFDNCNPTHPTPVLQIHGTNDSVVPYTGNAWSKSISEVVDYWVTYNNCNTQASTNPIPDVNVLDGSTAEHMIYAGGDKNATTEHIKITGGDHTWPGTLFITPGTNLDFNASHEIWKFFARYNMNGLTGTTDVSEQATSNLSIYPNPTRSHIFIDTDFQKTVNYQVVSLYGHIVARGTLTSSHETIDLSGLPMGTYMLRAENIRQKIVKIE